MELICTKIITTEVIDHITGDKSTSIVKFWEVEYKNKKYTRYLDNYKIKWENPEMDHIKAMMYATNFTNKPSISNDELETLFRKMIRESKLENILK